MTVKKKVKYVLKYVCFLFCRAMPTFRSFFTHTSWDVICSCGYWTTRGLCQLADWIGRDSRTRQLVDQSDRILVNFTPVPDGFPTPSEPVILKYAGTMAPMAPISLAVGGAKAEL